MTDAPITHVWPTLAYRDARAGIAFLVVRRGRDVRTRR
jgi:hypothetical protein